MSQAQAQDVDNQKTCTICKDFQTSSVDAAIEFLVESVLSQLNLTLNSVGTACSSA